MLLLPLALSRANIRTLARHWKPLLAFAFFEIIAAWLLLSNAERHLTSSTTGLLIAATPIIAAVLDRFTGGTHRLGGIRLAGLGIGIVGVAVLAGPGLSGGGAWPITQVLLTATCYAIAPLIAARHLTGVPALPLTAGCLTVAALVYAAPAALHWPSEIPSSRVIVATVLLAVLCTAAAFIIFFALIREAGPTRALVITYVNPAVALLAGSTHPGRTTHRLQRGRTGAHPGRVRAGDPAFCGRACCSARGLAVTENVRAAGGRRGRRGRCLGR